MDLKMDTVLIIQIIHYALPKVIFAIATATVNTATIPVQLLHQEGSGTRCRCVPVSHVHHPVPQIDLGILYEIYQRMYQN